jgi:hypothetical protein
MIWSSFEDGFNSLFTICAFMVTIAFPIFTYAFLKLNQSLLEDEIFKSKYESLYEDSKTTNMKVLSYSMIFCLRRIFFAFLAIFFHEYTTFQLIVNVFSNLFVTAYMVLHFPFKSKFKN